MTQGAGGRRDAQQLAHQHAVVAGPGAASCLFISDRRVEALILHHRLMRFEPNFVIAPSMPRFATIAATLAVMTPVTSSMALRSASLSLREPNGPENCLSELVYDDLDSFEPEMAHQRLSEWAEKIERT
jgi:hypothetical protein